MRCVYCYNPDIVLGKGKLTFEDALSFIKTRKNLLDGVVLSGGECTLHASLISLIEKIKDLGMLVKIDTNGSKPDVLQKLINNRLIDYVSLDFKANKQKFKEITGSNLYHQFIKSLKLLIQSNIPFEVRTTIHSDLINEYDIDQILNFLEESNYKGKYYLQNYVNDVLTLGNINNSRSKWIDLNCLNTKLEVVIRN